MSQTPASQTQYPCANCGANVEFAPGTTVLKCPYCGAETSLAPTGAQIREHSYAEFADLPRKPIAILAPVMATGVPRMPSPEGWFAVLYNIFLAGTVAHWAWYRLARTLPVAVSSMSSLPVPVVGVFSGMLFLGERPGPAEWAALALIMAAMVAVLWPPRPLPARRAAPDD